MKPRLIFLFAIIVFWGFTATSKQRVRITNAESVILPSLLTGDDYRWMGNDTIDCFNTTTLLLDTERDENGNALRRHVFVCQGGKSVVSNNRLEPIIGTQEVSRLSFPADEAGLAQWRRQLVRLFASENRELLAETEKIKEKLRNGQITEAECDSLVRGAIIRQAQDSSCYRPFVIIKPMGNAESGDVIDALTVMEKCYISAFQIEDITHPDSVIVFNSLYLGKDMPSDVNFYTFGNIADYPQEFDFSLDVPKGYEDIDNDSSWFVNDLGHTPILTIGVETSKQNENGAVAYIMFDKNRYKEFVLMACSTRKEKRAVERTFASKSFKAFVNKYGNSVNNPHWIVVEPADFQNISHLNKFQKPIQDMLNFWDESHAIFFHCDELLIYTNRHTPFSALKCVIDNLRQLDFYTVVLAY